MNDMAILYEAMGKYHEAEDMYLKSLQTRRVKLGDENLHAFVSYF
jgi:predicted DNA-binding protein